MNTVYGLYFFNSHTVHRKLQTRQSEIWSDTKIEIIIRQRLTFLGHPVKAATLFLPLRLSDSVTRSRQRYSISSVINSVAGSTVYLGSSIKPSSGPHSAIEAKYSSMSLVMLSARRIERYTSVGRCVLDIIRYTWRDSEAITCTPPCWRYTVLAVWRRRLTCDRKLLWVGQHSGRKSHSRKILAQELPDFLLFNYIVFHTTYTSNSERASE